MFWNILPSGSESTQEYEAVNTPAVAGGFGSDAKSSYEQGAANETDYYNIATNENSSDAREKQATYANLPKRPSTDLDIAMTENDVYERGDPEAASDVYSLEQPLASVADDVIDPETIQMTENDVYES